MNKQDLSLDLKVISLAALKTSSVWLELNLKTGLTHEVKLAYNGQNVLCMYFGFKT